jgi:hypothetical protein
MSNMSYCRFQNTLKDMNDCAGHVDDELGGAEFKARKKLVELCRELAENFKDVDLDEEYKDADLEDEE